MIRLITNKKGQTGDTITWMIASIVIIAVLFISILISGAAFDKKTTGVTTTSGNADTLASKSFSSYLLTEDAEGKIVYLQIKEQEKLGNFSGNLGLKIFRVFYEEYENEYASVWLGVSEPAAGNGYFGTKPSVKANTAPDQAYTSPYITERIKLNEKELELLLIKKSD